MFARSGKWLVVAALVLSLGGHWAILQSVAWVQMAATFAQTETLPVALSKTFNGKTPCKLCKLVSAGKKAEKESASKVEVKKLDSALAAPSQFFFPQPLALSVEHPSVFRSYLSAPTSPPPKSA